MPPIKFTPDQGRAGVPQPATEKWPLGVWFSQLFQRGTLSIEYYAPKDQDFQTPHTQDEVYIIISGTGEFMHNGETVTFAAGDVLFVPAGEDHRFQRFSPDFATWVIFYGPPGGERP